MLTIALAFSVILMPAAANAKVTDAATPDKANYGILNWERSFGSGSGMSYQNAPTPPVVSGDHVYLFSGSTVYQLSAFDGSIEKKWPVTGTPQYATIPLTVSDDGKNVFGFAHTGRIFNIDVSGSEVKYADKAYKGQNINPLTYKNGYLYGGTWESTDNDGNTTDPGTYFCIDVSTMKVIWEFQDTGKTEDGELESENGGFYWDGAYVTDDGAYTVFCNSGIEKKVTKGNTASTVLSNGYVYAVNHQGEEVSRYALDSGTRCSVAADHSGYLYFASSLGTLYKMKMAEDGTLTETSRASLGGESRNTPVIDGDHLFIAFDSGVKSFDISGDGLEQIDSEKTPSVIKGEILYSTSSKCLYGGLYEGGSIYYLKVNENGEFAEKGNLFTPAHTQYGISPIDCDADGNLYYKNDSGYLMCVRGGYDTSAPVLSSAASSGYRSIKLVWKQKKNIVSYQIRRSDGKTFTVSAEKTSYTDRSAVTGKKYSYSIRALLGENLYSAYSGSKSAKAIPKATTVSTREGKKKITVKWKKVSGASQYQVYRSAKKKSGYKKVKTTKSLKWTNRKLKSKKKYYYKVRSYTTVKGKNVYSKWSNVSGKKVK